MVDLVYLDYGIKLLELCASDCPDLRRERVLAICRAVSEDGTTPHEVYKAIMDTLK